MASSYVEQPMGRCVGRSLAHALRIHALHCTTLVHNQPVKELSTFTSYNLLATEYNLMLNQ